MSGDIAGEGPRTAVTIREARAADYPAIADLYQETDAFHAAHVPDIFRAPATPLLGREFLDRLLADARQALFVAEQGGRLVGLAQVVLPDRAPSPALVPAHVAYVNTLLVSATARAGGIGRALMGRVEGWAREQAATAIECTVWEFPGGALPFYERLGYATRARRLRKPL